MASFDRRELLKLAGAAGAVGAAGTARALTASGEDGDRPVHQPDRGEPDAYEQYQVRRVPEEYASIREAVSAAQPRDLVSIAPGTYTESVTVTDTPRLTIRGRDRNGVVLDGEFSRRNGIVIQADDVVVENLTVRNYEYNGVYWLNVEGYRGSYLTVHNNGNYGIYAFGSVHGRFDHCYASGHPDSGFYIGQCSPCHAVIRDVLAERNGLGYSGTNAGGYLTLRDSEWRENMAGILPNTLDSEELAPQDGARIQNNHVHDNNNDRAPTKDLNFPAFGTGINVAGGSNNEIYDNDVHDHPYFGIAVSPMVDKQLWQSAHNEVRDNQVRRSGRADLAIGLPEGGGNCFADNDFSTSRPPDIEDRFGCDGRGLLGAIPGDLWPTLVLGRAALQAELGETPGGDWRETPAPDSREGMTDPEAPPRRTVGGR